MCQNCRTVGAVTLPAFGALYPDLKKWENKFHQATFKLNMQHFATSCKNHINNHICSTFYFMVKWWAPKKRKLGVSRMGNLKIPKISPDSEIFPQIAFTLFESFFRITPKGMSICGHVGQCMFTIWLVFSTQKQKLRNMFFLWMQYNPEVSYRYIRYGEGLG